MRGAPQVEFSATIRKISSRTSLDSFFLPICFLTFEIQLQYSRNPARCQRTTVSGVTTRRDLLQSVQNRHASTQKSLSKGLSFGLGPPTLQYREFLAKRQILQKYSATRTKATGLQSHTQPGDVQH